MTSGNCVQQIRQNSRECSTRNDRFYWNDINNFTDYHLRKIPPLSPFMDQMKSHGVREGWHALAGETRTSAGASQLSGCASSRGCKLRSPGVRPQELMAQVSRSWPTQGLTPSAVHSNCSKSKEEPSRKPVTFPASNVYLSDVAQGEACDLPAADLRRRKLQDESTNYREYHKVGLNYHSDKVIQSMNKISTQQVWPMC